VKVEVSGHTDTRGSEEVNMKLSEARAGAVAGYLVKNGIAKKQIESKGYGESKPVASGSASGW